MLKTIIKLAIDYRNFSFLGRVIQGFRVRWQCSAKSRLSWCKRVFAFTEDRDRGRIDWRVVFPQSQGNEKLCIFMMTNGHFDVNIADHERIHIGEKPFSCDKCKRKFSRKRSLAKHSCKPEKKLKDWESRQGETVIEDLQIKTDP